ncbi:hypothetical protein [Ruegeria sp. ANG-R]|uniref:hypothetical protein n=1 Tax=Ruegeria sp. ANG-R TaxID=1577903 RepID=UPI00187C8615|nr:hypothetical protein [Ruegeria sp. ANG-R]
MADFVSRGTAMGSNKLKNLIVSAARAFTRFLIVLLELIVFAAAVFTVQQANPSAPASP